MAVSYTIWYDELAMNCPGATIPGMEQAVKRTLAQFLRESGAWVKELSGIALKANKSTYAIVPQPEGPILYIMAIWHQNKFLTPMTMPDYRSRVFAADSTAPVGYTAVVDKPGEFIIHPTLNTDSPYKAIPVVAFGFSPNCKEYLPDIFCMHWYDAILCGATQRLASQQDKPYTNVTVAQLHGVRFRNYISQARDMARRQVLNVESDFRFPKWA